MLAERYGVDALRYFLLREFPFGSDGNFSNELLISRINTDLANDLGNLLSAAPSAMVIKYFGGTLPGRARGTMPLDDELIAMASALRDDVCEAIWSHFGTQQRADRGVSRSSPAPISISTRTAPWVLAKDESKRARLATVLYNLLETLRITVTLLLPFMPDSCAKAFTQIGAAAEQTTWDNAAVWGVLPADVTRSEGRDALPAHRHGQGTRRARGAQGREESGRRAQVRACAAGRDDSTSLPSATCACARSSSASR